MVGGDTSTGTGKSQQFFCTCTVLFMLKWGEQTTLTSFGALIIFLIMHWGIGYKRKACKSLGAVVWVSGTEQLGQLLGGH